jgi:hypothetical protein
MTATNATLSSSFAEGLSPHPEIRTGVQGTKENHHDHWNNHRGHCAAPQHTIVEAGVRNFKESAMGPHFIVYDSFVHDLLSGYHVVRAMQVDLDCPHQQGDS